MKPLPLAFYRRDPRQVAPDLLNKVIVVGDRRARIVETEAYLGRDDPGSHSYRGPTPRNATMFGPAGRLYVYFTYGMHWCANAVCGPPTGGAVLLRAAEPLSGLDEMRAARSAARRDRDLCSGPAKLCQALGLTGEHDGVSLRGPEVVLADDGTPPPRRPARGLRVGLTAGAELSYRWWVPGDPNVSRGPVSLRVDPDGDGRPGGRRRA
jgi:DNA-3-methyladenine glycosylase